MPRVTSSVERNKKNTGLVEDDVSENVTSTPRVTRPTESDVCAAISMLKDTIHEIREENRHNMDILRSEINEKISLLSIASPLQKTTLQEPPQEVCMPQTSTGHVQVPYGLPTEPVAANMPQVDQQQKLFSSQAQSPTTKYLQINSVPSVTATPQPSTWSLPMPTTASLTNLTCAPPSLCMPYKPSAVYSWPPCTISTPTTEDVHTSRQQFQTAAQQQHTSLPCGYGMKLYPLPTFDGKLEEWPLFLTSFNETTVEFGYSNKQNLIRLHKALQGEAKQAVSSMLIFPNDVPKAIEELAFNFGRPELLIRSQIGEIKAITAIVDKRIDLILPFANRIRNMVSLFKSAGCHHHLMNTTLLDQLVAKLPLSKQYEWAKFAATVQPFPTVESFSVWINDLAKVVSLMTAPVSALCSKIKQSHSIVNHQSPPKTATRRILHSSETTIGTIQACAQCRKGHFIAECDQFKALAVDDRWVQVKRAHLCFGCLKKGHSLTICRKKRVCSTDNCCRMHHPLLHQTTSAIKTEHVLNCRQNSQCRQLFKIVPVTLSGPSGEISVYAMLDEGSSISLLEEKVAITLGLKGQSMALTLQWYGDKKRTQNSTKVSVLIKGNFTNAQSFALKNVRTVKDLNLPSQTFNRKNFSHTKDLPVDNYNNAKPVLLLGLDNSFLGVYKNVIEAETCEPIAAETKLGWVVFGPVCQIESFATVLHISESQPSKRLIQLVEEYFSIENFGVRSSNVFLESEENRRAREILKNTTKYMDGYYVTGLLWRRDEFQFPSSYEMAERRLRKIEAKMQTNSQYAEKYKQEMTKYIKKGYARLLSPEEVAAKDSKTWYLPHFGVVNPNKPEKLRIVFDAAATVSNVSLNSALIKGPEHAQSLIRILFQFRQGIVAVAGDIQEMFSQVRIQSVDQNSQRFLWRNGNSDKPIQTYAMVSMIFGAACSPCCAEYVKNINANKYKTTMPNGCKAVIENTYVDDLVASFNSESEAEEIVSEAIKINQTAGFNLRNFVSSSKEVQSRLNGHKFENNIPVNLEYQKTFDKILGLFWNTKADTLEFHFEFHKIPHEVVQLARPPTKREMLGIIMAIFDPFGLLANFTIASKIIFQSVWKLQIGWDEELPYQLFVPWSKWWNDFKCIQKFSIPRCYSPLLYIADEVQLHIFTDASSNAYAAVAYLRIKSGLKTDVALVAAKSRCAPVKGMTIPRLELQAAVLGCRLKELIFQSLEIIISKVIFWCDSKTVVLWIRSSSREYKQFVACRIAEILSSSTPVQWHWLPSAMNVADDATKITNFIDNTRWIKGPGFLHQSEESWPKEPSDMISESCHTEEISLRILFIAENGRSVIEFGKFSSYLKLLRVTAWILRFFTNSQLQASQRRKGEITAAELADAETTICRLVQAEIFIAEIDFLRLKGYVPKSSDLYQLTPHLGPDGVMRVKGRIDAAYCLPVSARQPIIMPRLHHVTRLLLENVHKKRHHQNDRLVINEMRQKFWVPSALSLMKSVRKNCPVCIAESAKPKVPLMGQLPTDRLTPYVRPFTYTGVDYCGPFYVTIGRRKEKRWISLFTCLTTRGIHLEIASDLSADAFLLCLRNFMNRRGTPVRIRSDNGTNFVRAQKELTASNRLFDIAEVQRFMCQNRIDWVFNCPLYPNAGGCWERLIQCTKRLLSRVLKEEAPRLETFRSAIIEAENIINSRPLTELPLSPEEDEPQTPNHFLMGCMNSTQTPNVTEEPVCLRKQWRIAQNIKDRLWKRWIAEYLPQLLRRSKWRREVEPLKPGQLVIICESKQPRSQWEKGYITEVFTAKDGQVRSAEVRTSRGLLRRPA